MRARVIEKERGGPVKSSWLTRTSGSVPKGFENLLARDVKSNPAAPECLAVGKEWLDECLSGHENCQRLFQEDKPLPTRVLDVGSKGGDDKVRLFVTNGKHDAWAALSYCWGGDSVFICKQERLEDMQKGIPLEDFPKTLHDAVVITRNLGIRYLWIDALCIIQDSKEDWAAEAARMEYVYRGAKVTISAISSPGTGFGMFHEREDLGPQCELEWKGADRQASKVYLRSGSVLGDTYMKDSPLNTRGWTLQEALLAPRVLSYGSQQMIWECVSHRIDEGGRPVAPGQKYRDKKFMQELFAAKTVVKKESALQKLKGFHIFDSGLDSRLRSEVPYDRWFDIVSEYTTRRLTVGTDVLPALAGLAKAFQNMLNDKYAAGLWTKDVLRGLQWTIQPLKSPDAERMASKKRPDDYHIPSWSWASIHGKTISFLFPPTDEYTTVLEEAKVLSVSTTPRLTDPFGQTSSGIIELQASYHQIANPQSSEPPKCCPVLETAIQKAVSNVRSSSFEFAQQHREHTGQEFGVVLLVKSEEDRRRETPGGRRMKWTKFPRAVMMIVETTGNEGEYRRIGLQVMTTNGSSKDDMTGMEFFDEMKKVKWEKKVIKVA